MLDNIKYHMILKSIDKAVADNHFEMALSKLNNLIKEDYKPSITYLKRGLLCKKLLMYDNAYSDFTYIIEHCAEKKHARYERALLNFEIANYYEAILDANSVLSFDENNFDIKKIKFLSLVYSKQNEIAKEYVTEIFENNKYKTLQFLFNDVAQVLAQDEYTKGLMLLDVIDEIDKDNPIKTLKEATIYGFIGNHERQQILLEKLEKDFPKYFVSHYRFRDMFQSMDIMEISFLSELAIFDKHKIFAYPLKILEGYKNYLEGHIQDSKKCFEDAININPSKADAYVLLAQTLQLMSGYDNASYRDEAEENYKTAEGIYLKDNLPQKAEAMRRQIKHLNSNLILPELF